MGREFNVLSKLSAVYAPAPKPLLFCNDKTIIGSEFYLMERRHGLIVRGKFPDAFSSDLNPGTSQSARLATTRSFIANLADLHKLDYAAAGLETLGHSEGYNRRQVESWTIRYFAAKTDEHKGLESAIHWLNENIPFEFGTSLIHNDYKFDNVMLDPNELTKITAVLDWEMVTVGDPLMDLGTTLGYWMSADAGEEMLTMSQEMSKSSSEPSVLSHRSERRVPFSPARIPTGADCHTNSMPSLRASSISYWYADASFSVRR